jgi:hypothetical protein
MDYRLELPDGSAHLRGPEGELVFLKLRVPARSLEQALDTLAQASFPVNPEIRHGHPLACIEFPAYDRNVDEVRNLLKNCGLGDFEIEVASALLAMR